MGRVTVMKDVTVGRINGGLAGEYSRSMCNVDEQ